MRYISHRSSVETVTAYPVLLANFVRKRIGVSIVRHGLVESRIEHKNLLNVGQFVLNGFVALEVSRIMKRSKLAVLFPFFKNFGSNHHTMGKFSTMHYAMSHSIDLRKRFYGSVLGIGELRKNEIDALLMICYFHLYLLAVAVSGF